MTIKKCMINYIIVFDFKNTKKVVENFLVLIKFQSNNAFSICSEIILNKTDLSSKTPIKVSVW